MALNAYVQSSESATRISPFRLLTPFNYSAPDPLLPKEASLEFIAFAASAALVAGAAYDVVQEAFAVDNFAGKNVFLCNL